MGFTKYNPKLKERARELRSNSMPSEIKLWKSLRAGKMLGIPLTGKNHWMSILSIFTAENFSWSLKLTETAIMGKKNMIFVYNKD